MHKDPPPGLFDARRPLSHAVTYGLVAGFVLTVILHFGWSLWRQNSGVAAAHPTGPDALVTGLDNAKPPPTATAIPPAVRY